MPKKSTTQIPNRKRDLHRTKKIKGKARDEFAKSLRDAVGLPPNKNQSKSTWVEIKNKWDDGSIAIDAHSWVENADGMVVFDPDFPEYFMIRKVRNLRVGHCYKEFDPLLTAICKKQINPTILTALDDVADQMMEMGRICSETDIYKVVMELCDDGDAMAGRCFLNAWCYQKLHPDTIIKIGSLGWMERRSKEIHWEYG